MSQAILTSTLVVPVADGTQMTAWLARPRDAAAKHAVIVAPELFGLSSHVRSVCERLARNGRAALALDPYHRVAPGVELPEDDGGRQRGFELLAGMSRTSAVDDVRAAVDALKALGHEAVSLLGLSVGGHVGWLAAAELDLSSLAVLYAGWLADTRIVIGQPEPTLTLTDRIRCPVLYLVGEDDVLVTSDDRSAIAKALADAGVQHEMVVYPGVAHGFLNESRAAFDHDASLDAWRRLLEWL